MPILHEIKVPDKDRHTRACGYPEVFEYADWIPAFAGMTINRRLHIQSPYIPLIKGDFKMPNLNWNTDMDIICEGCNNMSSFVAVWTDE